MFSKHILRAHLNRSSSFLFSTYKRLSENDISHFRSILTPSEVIHTKVPDSFNQDWTGRYTGNSELVLCPDSNEKISRILQYCNSEKIAITPQGGNTGFNGGAIASNKEVILSLANLNKIAGFHPNLSVISCQAGCTLATLNNYLAPHGYEIPVDIEAAEKAQIGGLASSNARPLRLTKFGSFKSHILGLEAITADGQVLDMRSIIRKDNTGLDMKQLFIGTEGTMGIITRLDILAQSKPHFVKGAVFSTTSFEKALNIAELSRDRLGRHLSALEFRTDLKKEKSEYSIYMLASGQEDLSPIFSELFEQINAKNLATSTKVSNNDEDTKEIYKLREKIPSSIRSHGPLLHYDILIDPLRFEDFAQSLKKNTSNVAAFEAYGYVGDGTNIHLAIAGKNINEIEKKIESTIYENLEKFGGNVTAEHGIGKVKPEFIKHTSKKSAISFMKRFKKGMDPNNILNPGKVFIFDS